MSQLKAGDRAPAFSGIDQDGNPIGLKALLARGPLVLYFYPKDMTPGCTTEACDFRDLRPVLRDKGMQVVGVSPDGPASHRKFIDKHGLGFPLIADENHAIAEAYGAWGEKKNYGRVATGLRRSTFVIGTDGRIREAFYNVKATGHAARVVAHLG